MRKILSTAAAVVAASMMMSGAALAETTPSKPEAGVPHPPENRMDQATPQMHAPDESAPMHAPTNRIGEVVPPMKAGDKAKTSGTGTQTPPAENAPAPSDEKIPSESGN